MSRQTIFAYAPQEERASQVFSVAASLATRDHSHLIGAYVIPPLRVFPTMAELPQASYDGQFQMHEERAKVMKGHFDKATATDEFVSEWRTIDSAAASVGDALMDHVRCADIAVVPHYGPNDNESNDSDSAYINVAETLLMESGRPVLMLPKHMNSNRVGDHIAVAWDGSRESVRAVFDAIELLQNAKSVRILSISETRREKGDIMLPGAEIAATLTRRGVICEADHVDAGGLSIGDAILGRAADMGSDLLVMGAYGHSKLREFVFGGVTRHILQHMTVPVLMSH